jgi:hypothetical protein
VARQSRDRRSGEVAAQLGARPGGGRGQRLVEQKQPGVGRQRARQRHALRLSTWKRPGPSAYLPRQAKPGEPLSSSALEALYDALQAFGE